MIDPFAPTTVGTASCRFVISANPMTSVLYYSQFNFLMSGTPTTGVPAFFFWDDFRAKTFTHLANAMPVNAGSGQFTLNMNFPGGLKRLSGTYPNAWIPPLPLLPNQVCTAITLVSVPEDRRGTGLFRIPNPALLYTDGDYINGAFEALVAPFLNWWVLPYTVFGVTFTPCVWSRAGNLFQPVIATKLHPNVRRLHKRRPWRSNTNPWISLPDIWP